MPSGGARPRSGPPADPNALRRDRPSDAATWTTLPAEGRVGDPPPFPLPRPNAREKQLWESLWAKPQAIMWEQMQVVDQVGLYVRRWTEAEKRDAGSAAVTVARQLGDALGLTLPGLSALRWRIAPDEVGERRIEATAPPRLSSRQRLTVVVDDRGA